MKRNRYRRPSMSHAETAIETMINQTARMFRAMEAEHAALPTCPTCGLKKIVMTKEPLTHDCYMETCPASAIYKPNA